MLGDYYLKVLDCLSIATDDDVNLPPLNISKSNLSLNI
jgi:hypothetical protein